jgi:hypothetical protein
MRLLAVVVCALCCAVPAKADTFWFAEPSSQAEAEGNAVRDCVRGALLSEDADHYVVRVVGGEITLAKKSVVRVEKDDLTVDAIAKMEADAAEALAQADAERRMRQANARARRDVAAAEASVSRAEPAKDRADSAASPMLPAPGFDPVLRAMRMNGSKQQLVREATLAFERTGDRDLLRLMRQLRRM